MKYDKEIKDLKEEEEIAIEMLARSKARKRFVDFARYIVPEEPPAFHHEIICNTLDDVIDGIEDRVMIFLPPGSAKSTYTSVRFPPYYLGRFPEKKIICGSYGEGLSTTFGRKVRNIVDSNEYGLLFETRLSEDSRAKGEWETKAGGAYFACGVGSGVTGRRADLLLIDDPIKGRKDADSETVRNDTWNWYLTDFSTRKKPGAAIIVIQCMTGDTSVTMGDGSHKDLRNIKVGDEVATYDNGKITSSKVLNWKNQGLDSIYKIKTSSGIIVRANERHPFLVEREGRLEWVRLKNIIVGESVLTATGENGKVLNAPSMDAKEMCPARECAHPITTKNNGLLAFAHHLLTKTLAPAQSSSIAMALRSMITESCFLNREGAAQYAGALQQQPETLNTGTKPSVSIIAMKRIKSEGFSATTAILRLGKERLQKLWRPQQPTSGFTLDQITSIEPDGIEDVFDIQVERTENFIANGLISHNTRWHEDDLAGRILPPDWNGESGRFEGFDGKMWKVISIAAEARENDILGRKVGEWLWTEYMTPEYWETEKRTQTSKDTRNWMALFQQVPRPESGTFFQREWFKRYPLGSHPPLTLYGASDCAVTDEVDGGLDVTEHGIAGFDKYENLYFVDWWSGRVTMDKWIISELKLARRYPIMAWIKEVGVIRRAVEPFLKKAKREGIKDHDGKVIVPPTYFRSEWLGHIGDKGANARGFQALASMGQVYIPECEWGDQLIDQLVKFIPNTNFLDDKVDVCGLFGRILDQTFGPRDVEPEPETQKDGYGFDDEPEKGWKVA